MITRRMEIHSDTCSFKKAIGMVSQKLSGLDLRWFKASFVSLEFQPGEPPYRKGGWIFSFDVVTRE